MLNHRAIDAKGISKNKKKILAHPKAKSFCPVGLNSDTVLVIGPEGGFSEREIEALQAAKKPSAKLSSVKAD